MILIGCALAWVPVESVGPTYDDVWNGRPLPDFIFGEDGIIDDTDDDTE